MADLGVTDVRGASLDRAAPIGSRAERKVLLASERSAL